MWTNEVASTGHVVVPESGADIQGHELLLDAPAGTDGTGPSYDPGHPGQDKGDGRVCTDMTVTDSYARQEKFMRRRRFLIGVGHQRHVPM